MWTKIIIIVSKKKGSGMYNSFFKYVPIFQFSREMRFYFYNNVFVIYYVIMFTVNYDIMIQL